MRSGREEVEALSKDYLFAAYDETERYVAVCMMDYREEWSVWRSDVPKALGPSTWRLLRFWLAANGCHRWPYLIFFSKKRRFKNYRELNITGHVSHFTDIFNYPPKLTSCNHLAANPLCLIYSSRSTTLTATDAHHIKNNLIRLCLPFPSNHLTNHFTISSTSLSPLNHNDTFVGTNMIFN